jgi:hypothetical protein
MRRVDEQNVPFESRSMPILISTSTCRDRMNVGVRLDTWGIRYMTANPYKADTHPPLKVKVASRSMSLFLKFIGYASIVAFAFLLLSFILIPEELEGIAAAWSKFQNPNTFADYTLAYRFGIPACGLLLLNGILFIIMSRVFAGKDS